MRALDYRRPPEEPEPAEVIARLHEEIARLVPDGAELVARWDRLQEALRRGEVRPVTSQGREERIGEFGDLLAQGLSPAEAAAALGIAAETAKKYRLALRRQERDGDAG